MEHVRLEARLEEAEYACGETVQANRWLKRKIQNTVVDGEETE
jgi:hypothetical protein